MNLPTSQPPLHQPVPAFPTIPTNLPPVVYVAGPYRAPDNWQIEANVRRAETLALEVWRLGAAAICPHANTRFYQGAAPDDVWLIGDLAMLKKCDAILMTPDWAKSMGATAERDFAVDHGIPVFYAIQDLEIWIQDNRLP